MDQVVMLLIALGGGALGATLGANYALILSSVAILTGTGVIASGAVGPGQQIIDTIALGPMFGPHVAFAGAVAAAAYAGKKRYRGVDGLKDIVSPLAGTGQISVWIIGAVFGGLGWLINYGLAQTGWFAAHTETVFLTVVISAIAVRFIFGDRSLFNRSLAQSLLSTRNKAGDEVYHWLPWQEKPRQFLVLGLAAGLIGGGVGALLPVYVPGLSGDTVKLVPFAFAALALIILNLGGRANMAPLTHHMMWPAALAGAVFYDVFAGGVTAGTAETWPLLGAVVVGAAGGVLGAALGEFFARLWNNRGTTHIDPALSSIWLSTLVVTSAGALAGCSFC